MDERWKWRAEGSIRRDGMAIGEVLKKEKQEKDLVEKIMAFKQRVGSERGRESGA